MPDKPATPEQSAMVWATSLNSIDSKTMAERIIANLSGYKHKSKHAAADVRMLSTALEIIVGASAEATEIDAILDRLGRDIPVALDHMKGIVERLRQPLERPAAPPATEV